MLHLNSFRQACGVHVQYSETKGLGSRGVCVCVCVCVGDWCSQGMCPLRVCVLCCVCVVYLSVCARVTKTERVKVISLWR